MADTITPATYEQIVRLLTQLHTNYSNMASVFYDIFYNPNPKNVTFEMFDESNVLRTYTIKNLALSNQYRKIGNEEPEGKVPGAKGTMYQDLSAGEVYIKQSDSGNENWQRLVSKALLDGYIMQGNVNPNGVEDENGTIVGKVNADPGTLYVDTTSTIVYICMQNKSWQAISINTDGFVTKDEFNALEDVVDTKEDASNKVTSISEQSTDKQFPSAKAVYNYVQPQVNTLDTSVTNLQSSKQDKSNLVPSISSSSTDTQYPSAKCVYTVANNKQDKNLVTSISSSSTDEQYPSAKCVYDAIQPIKRNIGEIVTSTIPLVDAGLHPLDGSILDGNGIYKDFVNYMANVYDQTDKLYAYRGVDSSSNAYIIYTKTRTLYVGMSLFDKNGNFVDSLGPTGATNYTYTLGNSKTTIGRKRSSGGLILSVTLSYNSTYDETLREFCSISSWEDSVSKYGICEKFVYNSTDNTLRLPLYLTKHGWLVSSGSSGGDWYRIYSDGWCEQGQFIDVGTDSYQKGKQVLLLKPYKDTKYSIDFTSVRSAGANLYKPAVYEKTNESFYYYNLVANSPGGSWKTCGYIDISALEVAPSYKYIAVANTTKEDVEIDIDEITVELNHKVDKRDLSEVQCVIETYHSGSSWYRIWSDGWCEQGGIANGTGGASTVPLLVTFPLYYTLHVTPHKGGSGNVPFNRFGYNLTQYSFTFDEAEGYPIHWYACGYIL